MIPNAEPRLVHKNNIPFEGQSSQIISVVMSPITTKWCILYVYQKYLPAFKSRGIENFTSVQDKHISMHRQNIFAWSCKG